MKKIKKRLKRVAKSLKYQEYLIKATKEFKSSVKWRVERDWRDSQSFMPTLITIGRIFLVAAFLYVIYQISQY